MDLRELPGTPRLEGCDLLSSASGSDSDRSDFSRCSSLASDASLGGTASFRSSSRVDGPGEGQRLLSEALEICNGLLERLHEMRQHQLRQQQAEAERAVCESTTNDQ